jgi:hypothetical protein
VEITMPESTDHNVARLEAEIASLRAEVEDLKMGLAEEKQEVRTSVSGPRLSEVYVDAQIIPMSGWYDRSGKRRIELSPPDVNVMVGVKGQVGTSTTFTITINGKSKSETFILQEQVEYKPFVYPFSTFGL